MISRLTGQPAKAPSFLVRPKVRTAKNQASSTITMHTAVLTRGTFTIRGQTPSAGAYTSRLSARSSDCTGVTLECGAETRRLRA